jgi:hypothetical protein
MSYEGYYQVLCAKGHYHEVDVYVMPDPLPWDPNPKAWTCPWCGSPEIWRNSVDQTNTDGTEFEVKPRLRRKEVFCKCSKCKNVHMAKPAEYYIPKRKEK